MELPPGWRGYGAKNYIDNPETPIRQKEVDEIRAKMEAEGKRPLRYPKRFDALPPTVAGKPARQKRTY